MDREAGDRAHDFPLESALGRIAKAGLATMSELLDPDGVWDEDLIGLMLPVAIELEADQAEATFGAVAAAASSLFGKEGAEAFRDGLKRVRSEVRRAQVGARDEEPPLPGAGEARAPQQSGTAKEMLGIFGKMGLRRAAPKSP